jgi:carbonic anhydrase/acetyltransferase-like protein (isoleucine patch superfamily)
MQGKPPTFSGRDPEDEAGYLPNRLDIHPRAWIAPGAVVVGDVSIGATSSIWYGCVVRGDLEPIRIGEETNVQDLTVVHVDVDLPTFIGDRVTIGHRCVIHGCTVGDDTLVGMGAVLLSGCEIGAGSLIAAGAVVREGFVVPPRSVVAGIPAKVRGEMDDRHRSRVYEGVVRYRVSAEGYRSGRLGGGPYGGGPAPAFHDRSRGDR